MGNNKLINNVKTKLLNCFARQNTHTTKNRNKNDSVYFSSHKPFFWKQPLTTFLDWSKPTAYIQSLIAIYYLRTHAIRNSYSCITVRVKEDFEKWPHYTALMSSTDLDCRSMTSSDGHKDYMFRWNSWLWLVNCELTCSNVHFAHFYHPGGR